MTVTDGFPIVFPSNEYRKTTGGFKVKCVEHGWQTVEKKDLEQAGYAPGKRSSHETAKITWTHLHKAKKLYEDYENGKIQDFTEYVKRYVTLWKERAYFDIVGSMTINVELPCGCNTSVRFEAGEVAVPKEPKLHEVLLNLGLETEDDMTLVNKAFINEPQTQRILDACKKRAEKIITFLELCGKEERLLDDLIPHIKEALGDYIFPVTGIEQKIVSHASVEIENARETIMESRHDTVQELVKPLMLWTGAASDTEKLKLEELAEELSREQREITKMDRKIAYHDKEKSNLEPQYSQLQQHIQRLQVEQKSLRNKIGAGEQKGGA